MLLTLFELRCFWIACFSNSTTVHVERSNPLLGASPVLFHRCRSPRLKKSLLFHRWQRQQNTSRTKESIPRPQNLAERGPLQSGERNRGSTDSSPKENSSYSTKQNGQYLSKAQRRLQRWTRRLGRAAKSASCLIDSPGNM